MNRRGFLAGILAACAAPAIVRADSLMRIVPRDTSILLGDYDVIVEAGPSYAEKMMELAAVRARLNAAALIRMLPDLYGPQVIKILRPNAYKRITA